MKKSYQSEAEANGTVWTIDAATDDGRVTAEVMGASEFDGTVELQLRIDGNAVHLRVLEKIVTTLLNDLGGTSESTSIHDFRLTKGLPNAYRPWAEDEEKVLLDRWDAGDTVDAIAAHLGRGRGGVRSRLVKLGRINTSE